MESRLDSVRAGYITETVDIDTKFSDKNNLDLLITADALFHVNDISNADAAYEEFNKRNIDTTSGSFTREFTTLTLGANANDYRPFMMDTLFVSYYQLWAAISDGRWDDARVIINQSYNRQQKMSREYEKLIESNQKSLSKYSDSFTELVNENSKWTAYRDIMNPALMYLSGIYFLDTRDYSDAITYLDRANGMVPNNVYISQDLALAESHTCPQNMVWVFVEDGFAPKLTERRISLPFITKKSIVPITIAISEPKMSVNFMRVDGAVELADVDAMFMTEYQQYRVNDALRAFVSTTARTALQTSLYNSHNNTSTLLGIFSTIYSETTKSAEVRTWTTLPKTISVLRTENKTGLIDLKSNGNVFATISVPMDGNYLIYVRVGPNNMDTKLMKLK